MKYSLRNKISVLSVFSLLLIIIGLIYMIYYFTSENVRDPYGLGVFIILASLGAGLFGIFIHFLLSLLIKNRIYLNISELILVVVCLLIVANS